MNKEISALDLLNIIRKRIVLIILFCLTGILISSLLTFYVITPQYNSTSQLLVSQSKPDLAGSNLNISTNLQLINTYKDIIRGPIILEQVQDTLDLDMSIERLAGKVSVVSQENSQVFSVVVTDESPYQASIVANTVAETFANNISDIMSIDNVTIIARANPNMIPISPNLIMNVIIGFSVSLVLGFGLAVIFDWKDSTIKDEETIENELGWFTLGEIFDYTEEKTTTTTTQFVKEEVSDSQQKFSSVKNRV